jgi:uncharacterized integral membrane protein
MATDGGSSASRPRRACGNFGAVEKRQIAVLVLAALGGVFAALNLDEVDVNWIAGSWQTPLIVVIALSMLVGAALAWLVLRRRG